MSNKDHFIHRLFLMIKKFGFSDDVALFICAQFALESNYGASRIAIERYNLCGMKNPLVRISTAVYCGVSDEYWATYNSMLDCVIDYMLCLQYHKPMSDIKDNLDAFQRFIVKFYCPEKDYIDKINRIYQQLKS